jgi:hypothetical protein
MDGTFLASCSYHIRRRARAAGTETGKLPPGCHPNRRPFDARRQTSMKLFKCQVCGQLLYFENTRCERCSHRLGFIPQTSTLSALDPQDGNWRALAAAGGTFRFCANAEHDVCNWLVEAAAADKYCLSCRHNRTIPDVGVPDNLLAWRKIEAAKHRLFYTLLRLKLPLDDPPNAPDQALAFDFLAAPPQGPKVMTGHEDGLITIALVEADDVEREKRRTAMHEPYRTLVGHFRHEVGHYFWDRLVRDGGKLDACRAVFGDDRADYGQALQRYYADGAPADWLDNFVTPYATAHPWEDFAETWAHYLHIVDTLEMAGAFGMRIHPRLDQTGEYEARVDFDPYLVRDVGVLIDTWLPLSIALNSLNRTMGQPDIYPFVLSPGAIAKLGFIHDLIHDAAAATRQRSGSAVPQRAGP